MIETRQRTTKAMLAVFAALVMVAPVAAHSMTPQGELRVDGIDEPSALEGFNPDVHTGEPPVLEFLPPVAPGDMPLGMPDLGNPLGPAPMSHGTTGSCVFDGSNGGTSGVEYYNTYVPWPSGSTVTHENSLYKVFYICRTNWTDANGDRYVLIVTKDRQNSGSSNHVQSTNDYSDTGYYTANHNRWWPNSGHGELLIDVDPDSTRYFGNGDTLTFSLSYGGAGVSWSHTFSDGAVKTDDWAGNRVHWHTNSHASKTSGEQGWVSTYGAIQSVPEGTYAQTYWWVEVRWHHYNCDPFTPCYNHTHRAIGKCEDYNDPACRYKLSTPTKSSSSSSGGGGSGADATRGTSGSSSSNTSANAESNYDPCGGFTGYRDMGEGYCYGGNYYKR